MRTIKLDVSENVYEKVILYLNNLSKTDIKITEDKPEQIHNFFHSVSLKTKGYKFSRDEAHDR